MGMFFFLCICGYGCRERGIDIHIYIYKKNTFIATDYVLRADYGLQRIMSAVRFVGLRIVAVRIWKYPGYCKMLSPTNDWGSLTEDRLRRGNAAWQWLRSWISGGRVGSLESAMFCRLTSVGILLRKQSNTSIMYACLGHFTWACLVFPMVSDSTQQNMLLLKQGGHLDWLHIVWSSCR